MEYLAKRSWTRIEHISQPRKNPYPESSLLVREGIKPWKKAIKNVVDIAIPCEILSANRRIPSILRLRPSLSRLSHLTREKDLQAKDVYLDYSLTPTCTGLASRTNRFPQHQKNKINVRAPGRRSEFAVVFVPLFKKSHRPVFCLAGGSLLILDFLNYITYEITEGLSLWTCSPCLTQVRRLKGVHCPLPSSAWRKALSRPERVWLFAVTDGKAENRIPAKEKDLALVRGECKRDIPFRLSIWTLLPRSLSQSRWKSRSAVLVSVDTPVLVTQLSKVPLIASLYRYIRGPLAAKAVQQNRCAPIIDPGFSSLACTFLYSPNALLERKYPIPSL